MRLAAISDIHGNLLALEAVLDDIARRDVEAIVNLGDILSGPLQPRETAEFLMARDFIAIAGNHERQLLAVTTPDPGSSDGYAATQIGAAHAAWMRALASFHVYSPGEVLLVHGSPRSDLEYWLETVVPDGTRPATDAEVRERLGGAQASLVLCGHTHVARSVQCGATLIVNPGSVGLQAYRDEHPYPHAIENGSPHARYAIVERHAAGWAVEHHLVPYDWEAAARIAQAHGRPDWAHALRHGWMAPA